MGVVIELLYFQHHPALSEMGLQQPPLVAHLPTLSGGSKARVLVPLCGKAGCLTHLLKAGHDVVGIEGVESVVEEFFSENGLSVVRSDIPGIKGGRYSTADGRITIFACDLFDVTPEMVGRVDAVWDRGSFVALSFDTRPRYAALLKRLVGNSFRGLTAVGTFCKPGSTTPISTL